MTLTTNKTEKIKELFQTGINAWLQAGELVLSLVEEDKMSLQQIAQDTGISPDILAKFEQIGRRQIIPQLLVETYPAASRLLKLPYSEQKRYLEEPFELIIEKDGQWDTLPVHPRNMNAHQAAQAFIGTRARSAGAQRAYLESKRPKTQQKEPEELPYTIKGKRITFTRPTTLSAQDLTRILSQLTI